MCPHCQGAFCEAHLRQHTVYTTSVAVSRGRCHTGRIKEPDAFFTASNPCSECRLSVQKTGQCSTCNQFVCRSHQSHTADHRITSHEPRICQGYVSALDKLRLLGRLPAWTFDALQLPLPPVMHLSMKEAHTGDFPLLAVPALFDEEAEQLLENRSLAELLTGLLKHDARLEALSLRERVAALKATGCLGPLYAAMLASPDLKSSLVTILEVHLSRIQEAYDETKAVMRMDSDMPQRSGLHMKKSWSKKVFKLSAAAAPKDLSAVPDPQPLVVLDMTGSSWFAAMTRMRLLRKSVNAQHQRTRKPVWHLSVLHFGSHWVFAVNQKTRRGTGTTRIIWPLTGSEDVVSRDDHVLSKYQLRVLDLSYTEVARLVTQLLSPALKGDAPCAQAMLSILKGEQRYVRDLTALQLSLGTQHCALLKGMRIKGSSLELDARWWLTRKSRSAKNLDALGIKVSAYAALCNVLSILFIAEPRHAQSMFSSALMQLEEVAEGRISFAHLFGSLGGQLKHGRLLVGANVLKPPLKQEAVTADFSSSAQYAAIHQHVNKAVPTGASVKVERKRMAMPLADSPLHPPEDGMDYSHDYRKAVMSPGVAALPEYQPLMKVLFTLLLRKLSAVHLPDWVAGLPRYKPDEVEDASLAMREETEHAEDLDDDDT